MSYYKNIILLNAFLIVLGIYATPSYSKGKIYGQSKTLSKEYIKYENCRLRKTEINMKDGVKDGYKCIFKRQGKEKMLQFFNLHQYVKNHLNVKLRHNKEFPKYNILL